ncbi:isopeptide-forming domain-containing fimbrial protein [Arthrobacter sp. GMC3]|uniref:isopeptide-forming domain-containing fimbrial protein n=1 Tax=Arthrobacter sp. GMC3 TaxID=2058894 RepID=UPI0015E36940|nr:isopeptide-forming domain-containing fimbrial protein [Arthrobacter sp. GMC3]
MRKLLALLSTFSIVTTGLLVPVSAASADTPGITATKSAPASVLVGSPLDYTLGASNPSGPAAKPEYNVSFRDVLPAGVKYVPGSTTPTSAGEPTVFTDQPTPGQTTLVWRDVFDLQVGDSNSLSFKATPDVDAHPVGANVENSAQAFASTAPRQVPKFDAAGKPTTGFTSQAASNTTSTAISALTVGKSEPSPEAELLRGLHKHPTVYTLPVTNNGSKPTNGVVVKDYLPANLEFLGCGAVDNTTSAGTNVGSREEYPGSGLLTSTPGLQTPDCIVPASVTTVQDPAGYPKGVYTEVVWNLGTLAPGQSVEIKYAAGVPLRENAMFTTPPAPSSGLQGSNLDNNTGPLTRQDGQGMAATNYVAAFGTYTGPVADGTSPAIVATADHTVKILDLRLLKRSSTTQFLAGTEASFTLSLESGEYTDNSAITITDTIPNGICPLGAKNYATDNAPDCAPDNGALPTTAYESVKQNADGTFTVVFQTVPKLDANGKFEITYHVRLRANYTDGSLAGTPTSSGDSFTNTAVQTSTSNPTPTNTVDEGPKNITDPTSATLTTSQESLTKEIAKRVTPMDCSVQENYVASTTPLQDELSFVKGDRVCFRLTIAFSKELETRNAVLTDFLPENLAYEVGSAQAGYTNNVVGAGLGSSKKIEPSIVDGGLSWTLGSEQSDGTRTMETGAIFQVVFSAIVKGPAAGPAPDKADNLAKLRVTNSTGAARSLRAHAGFKVDPAPVAITKGVASVNGTTNPGGGDHVAVREGDAVRFQVNVSNTSGPKDPDTTGTVPREVSNVDVWDVLPLPLRCADISNISDGGVCTNPGDMNQPSFAGSDTKSAIRWTSDAVHIAAGQLHSYGYTVKIPAGTGVSEVLRNTAAVRSYEASTNWDGPATPNYPGNNIDTTVKPEDQDPNPVTDDSDVYLPTPSVAKGVVSAIKDAGNTGAEAAPSPSTQVVPGESVTYTVTAVLPAGATLFKGAFKDTVPNGFIFDSATADFAADGSVPSPSFGALPAAMEFTPGTTSQVTLGDVYDNTGTTPQIIRMTITAHADKSNAAVVNGAAIINTATLSSEADPRTGFKPTDVSASATTHVVEPVVDLLKSNDKSAAPEGVTAGTTVTYTLTASNASGKPTLHDAWVVDCIPAGLTFGAFVGPSNGATAPVSGTDPGNNPNCPANTKQLSWNVGNLEGGQKVTLQYTATVDSAAAGQMVYTNYATIAGNSLAGARDTPSDPGNALGRDYADTANSSVKVAGATSVKTVEPGVATIGQTVTYTVTTKLPANVNFYNATIVDTIPAGLDLSSVRLVAGSVSCTNPDASSCALGATTQLPVPESDPKIAFLLGDLLSNSQVRTIALKYTAKVADVAVAKAGAILKNGALPAWDVTAKAAPGDSGASFEQKGAEAIADLRIVEPNVGIAKKVSQTKPQPGDVFTYTVTATNAPTASAAYNVEVKDVVPANVIVDASTISGGGTIALRNPVTGGGGTITWTVKGPVAAGDILGGATGFTYSAKLAPSGSLTADPLTNSATVTGYDSLPTDGRHYTGPTATATVTPLFPKLTAAKATPNGNLAYLGEPFPWKVTVTNDAAAAKAYKVGATDVLPVNWNYVAGSARVSVNGGVATAVEPAVTTAGGVQTLKWTELGSLPAGTSLVINYTATPGGAVTTTPGVGMSVNHTNTATPQGEDATGATGFKDTSYSGPTVNAKANIASADVAIAKKVGVAPIAGSGGSWVLTVSNNGPDTATGPFTVTDASPLPAGIAITGATGPGWACTTSPVTCVRSIPANTLAKGAVFPDITVSYSVAADVADATAYANTASVTAHSYDPNSGNNTATATTTVAARADLGVQKTLIGSLVAGQNATYAIAVTNHGPSVSRAGFSVKDTLPAGTTFVSAAGTDWSCANPVDGSVTCTYAKDLAPGAVAPQITVVVVIPSSQTAAVINTATVTPVTPEPVDATHPNTDTVTTVPTTIADLGISKVLDSPLVAGANASYSIKVVNHGPSNARTVKVVDTLDAALSYVSFTGTDWSCTAVGQIVSCDYVANTGSFPATTPVTVSTLVLKVKVSQNLGAPVSNTATVTSTTTDNGPTPNTSTAPGTVTGVADLSISKTHTGTVTAGSPVSYNLAVHNAGPSNSAAPTTVTDTLPTGMSYTGATGTGWVCAAEGQSVTCTLAGNVLAGADAPALTITALVAANVGPSTLTNSANVTGGTGVSDPNIANNTATDPTNVTVQSSIDLRKTLDTPAPVAAGSNATFTLQATNNGPSDARDVRVSDTLPTYLDLVSASGDGWTCLAALQIVSCHRDVLAAADGGVAPPITLVTKVDPSTPLPAPDGTATIINSATISTSSPSTGPQGPVTAEVPVVGRADLAITKTGSAQSVVAGDSFTWTMQVNNNGPSDAAKAVAVTDELPNFQTFTSFKGDGWNCVAGIAPADPATGRQTVTCSYDALLAGASATPLEITVKVDPAATKGTVSNSAVVASPTPDPLTTNNTATAPVTVDRVQDFAITKSHTGNGTVGKDTAFTLSVRNNSLTTATKVHVRDPMPQGLTAVSATGEGWVCEIVENAVDCDLSEPLAPNAEAPAITVTATVLAQAYPSTTNVATVSSLDPELPGSKDASDILTVDPSAQLSIVKSHTGEFQVGSDASYTLSVTNNGPTPSPGPTTVTDVLPASLQFVKAAGEGWSCTTTGQTVSCDRAGELAIGDAAPITLTVKVLPAAFPSVANTATATGPGSTPATSTDTAAVNPLVAWSLSKTLEDYSNFTARYIITATNNGPNPTSTATTITDVLPAGLEFISATGDGSVCTNSAGTISCLHTGIVAAGGQIQVTVTTKVTAAPGTTVTNVAQVSGGMAGSSNTGTTAPTPDDAKSTATFTATVSGGLASTGATVFPLMFGGAGLMLLGLVLALNGRRRRRQLQQ